MVNVTVAVYDPVEYRGSLVSAQLTEPVLPFLLERASAPNDATGVAAVVLAVCLPVHAVPGAVTVQVYASASPGLGGEATDGPPGLKSEVTCNCTEPVPPTLLVRILYVKLVVPT
jgi:hypothetical protein